MEVGIVVPIIIPHNYFGALANYSAHFLMQNDAANEEIHRIVRQRAEIIMRGN